jgi:predicted AAA+ superfamily ATPase
MDLHGYVPRIAHKMLDDAMVRSPLTAILGPRQCGKSTLAHRYLATQGIDHVFLDLQDRGDLNKLTEPELFLEQHRHHLVCLDEIQLAPELFSVLRVEIDRQRTPGRFLILGSASRDLLRQSTETLAGRVAFLNLSPFIQAEVAKQSSWQNLLNRGGFPDSLLARDDAASFDWRIDFIRTFLERDIPQFGYAIPTAVMERLWRLLAHYHGQTVNYSKIAAAADLSVATLKRYLGLLEQTYMLRLLSPAESNLKKRLVKAPKLYLRDSGIRHALLDIETYDDLISHPVNGSSWEGFVVENLAVRYPRWQASYIRTSNNAEVDLLLSKGSRRVVVECKLSKAPKPSRGFHQLVAEVQPEQAWVVAPVEGQYRVSPDVCVGSVLDVRLE